MDKVEDRYKVLPCGCVYYARNDHIIRFFSTCDDCHERLSRTRLWKRKKGTPTGFWSRA